MGVPYIQAEGEGEAQASYMVEKGDAYCVGIPRLMTVYYSEPKNG